MKNHYRYYQRDEKSPWIAVLADGAEGEARANGAIKLTILATSAQLGGLDSGAAPKDLRFYGPLYFDIDDGVHLADAIDSARRLVAKLQDDYGLEDRDIQVFLSGKKGLHILINPECFGLTRSVVRLPAVFSEMAKQLYVSGLDLQVYSLRNTFRLVNMQRADGNYRVPIHVRELAELTPESYRDLVSQPRHDFVPMQPSGKLNTTLAVLFQSCTDIAKRAEKPATDSTTIVAPVLKQHFADTPPPCMQHLAEGRRAETASFNSMAMQVAIFAARLDADGLGAFQPVWDRIADNQHSTEYSTARLRKEHMEGQYKFHRVSGYQFSCNATRSVLKSRVCQDCPLEAAMVVESPEDAAEAVGISVRADGYFDQSTKGSTRRITSFTLTPECTFNEVDETGQMRRVGIMASIDSNGKRLGEILIEERSWANRAAFISALAGYGNASFFGNDTDIQKIRYMLTSDNELPEKTITRQTGMHIEDVDGREVRTYVEPSRSISSVRVVDSKIFQGANSMDPSMLRSNLKRLEKGDTEVAVAVTRLLNINDFSVTAVGVGWGVAAHLKAHLMYLYKQFPLVNLWGNAESGKTTVARYFASLGGTDYITEHEEMNAPATTPFPWLVALSNSTSSPVLIDEVNRSADRMPPTKYAQLGELLKAAWNGQMASKGYVGNGRQGAQVQNYKMTRPVIFCSEQQPELPAVLSRTLMRLCSTQARQAREGADALVREKYSTLRSLSYTLMLTALGTPTSEVRKMYEAALAHIPPGIDPRARYSHAVVLMGLHWLRQVLTDLQAVTEELDETLQAVEAHFLETCVELEQTHKLRQVRNEADKAFADILEIIGESVVAEEDGRHGAAPLRHGVSWATNVVAGRKLLYLDVRGAHTAYLMWSKAKGQAVVLDKLDTFCKLAMEEAYVMQMAKSSGILGGRHAFILDLEEAESRGLPTYYVGDVNEF